MKTVWIARDGDGSLCLYDVKPHYNPITRNFEIWNEDDDSGDCMLLSEDRFPEVTFENSPKEVELNILAL